MRRAVLIAVTVIAAGLALPPLWRLLRRTANTQVHRVNQ